MLIIGLTGGIGSGKSTVGSLFAQLQVPVIDSDVIAREVIDHDKTVLNAIAARFGAQVLDEKTQQLNRAKLRQVVFTDEAERAWLEQFLHPLIVAATKKRIMQLDAAYCLIVIPLLAEKPVARDLVDRVLVVDVKEEIQIMRTMQRDNHSEPEVMQILAAQATRAQRLSIADDIIHNEGDLELLQQQVRSLHQYYINLAVTTHQICSGRHKWP